MITTLDNGAHLRPEWFEHVSEGKSGQDPLTELCRLGGGYSRQIHTLRERSSFADAISRSISVLRFAAAQLPLFTLLRVPVISVFVIFEIDSQELR